MKRYFCVCALLVLALATPAGAQTSLLPDRFGAWSAAAAAQTAKPNGVAQNELDEAGLTSSQARTYSNAGRNLTVEVSQFKDPSGAYEIYTALINTSMSPSIVASATAVDANALLALVGNLVVKVSLIQNPSTEELRELLKTLRVHANQTPLPPIRRYLPEGFSDGTQKYSLGPNGLRAALEKSDRGDYTSLVGETGFRDGAETMLAEYHRGVNSAVVLLIEYPTPQLAEQHLRHLEQAIPPVGKAGTTIERRGSLLTLVLKPSSAAYGDALRNAVNYETEVTWNEPSHKITDPPWLVILGRIIILTLLFMGLAVAVGAAFGGVRVLLKTFFPGKVFDRPGQMDVLQLGLSSKRIDSRDFY